MSYSSNHDYRTAKDLRGTRLELAGATYEHREWIKSQGGTWNKEAKIWSLPLPSNTAAIADLLWQIVKRKMQWRAK